MASVVRFFLLVSTILSAAACTRPGELADAHAVYNRGVDELGQKQWEQAITTFGEAASLAKAEPQLHFRIAFNRGYARAQFAEQQIAQAPDKAQPLLAQAARSYLEAIAVGQHKVDDATLKDARINLELVRRRLRQLADPFRQGQDGKTQLEKRLDSLIASQRSLRDNVRQLVTHVRDDAIEAEPLKYRKGFLARARGERMLMAEAASLLDISRAESDTLKAKPTEELSQQESVQLFQLQRVLDYLELARTEMAQARGALRSLKGSRAHQKLDEALTRLKRARDQLHAPPEQLRTIAEDQQTLLRETAGLYTLSSQSLGGPRPATPTGAKQATTEPTGPPSWLSKAYLMTRQTNLKQRTTDVLDRMRAVADNQPGADTNNDAAQPSHTTEAATQETRVRTAAVESIPYLELATEAMNRAASQLAGAQYKSAVESQAEALKHVLLALDRFSDYRGVIEMAYREQKQITRLLDPDLSSRQGQKLSSRERQQHIADGLRRNHDRINRLQGLFAAAIAEADKNAAAAQPPQDPMAGQPQTSTSPAQQLLAQLREAEEIRVGAQSTHEAQQKSFDRGDAKLREHAEDTLERLTSLRRLFANIVEQLQELAREQEDTYDRTGSAAIETAVDARKRKLAGVPAKQADHGLRADEIALALEAQADAAGDSNANAEPAEPQAAPKITPQQWTEAATAARAAHAAMISASVTIDSVVQQLKDTTPESMPEALEHQQAAIQKLHEAIEILSPPKQDDKQGDKQNQNQDGDSQDKQDDKSKDDAQQQEPNKDSVSDREAQRLRQQARERDAQRLRDRLQKGAGGNQAVEKNW